MTRSATSFSGTATTVATAMSHRPTAHALASPHNAPTTRLPSCIGNQSTTSSQSGQPLIQRNTRCSPTGMSSPTAARMVVAVMPAPSTAVIATRT